MTKGCWVFMGAILGAVIGGQIANAILGPGEWGMQGYVGVIWGVPVGGLVGYMIGVCCSPKRDE